MRIPYFKPLSPIRRLAIELLLRWQALFLGSRPAVLVLQMGKVGSMSLAEAVRRTGKFRVFQFHLLNKDEIQESIAASESRRCYPPKHLYVSNFVINHVLPRSDCPKIITLVRDPVARNLSAYFENIQIYVPNIIHETPDTLTLIENFLATDLHTQPAEFFDKEIKANFHFDVYNYEFPPDRGHEIIRTAKIEILIMQFEQSEHIKKEAICRFLDISTITIPKLNMSGNKFYAEQYKKVLDTISLPREYLDRTYGSTFMTHFYSPHQIQAFRERWTRS